MSNENMPSSENPHHKIKMKMQKKDPNFTDSIDGLSLEDLKKNLLQYATYKEETNDAKAADEELNNAKELVKELAGPYNDTLSALKDKISYVHAIMVEKKTE